MSFPNGWELVLIVAVIVLLFGAKKLPDAARGIGRSLRIFKSEIKDPNAEEDAEEVPPGAPPQQTITAAPVPPVTQPYVAPVVQPVTQQPVAPVAPPQEYPAQPPVPQSPSDR